MLLLSCSIENVRSLPVKSWLSVMPRPLTFGRAPMDSAIAPFRTKLNRHPCAVDYKALKSAARRGPGPTFIR